MLSAYIVLFFALHYNGYSECRRALRPAYRNQFLTYLERRECRIISLKHSLREQCLTNDM